MAAVSGNLDVLHYLVPMFKKGLRTEDQFGEGILHYGCCNTLDNPKLVSHVIDDLKVSRYTRNKVSKPPFILYTSAV